MINRIIAFSIENKFIVLLFTMALCIWGIFAMKNLSIDAVPDITNNQVQVVTVSPSLAPEEVEQFITFPVEMAMANIQGVDNIRSISRYGLSVVTIVFDETFPLLDARQLVSEMLITASDEIPAEYGTPELMPITTGLGEIYQYTLEVEEEFKDQYTITELRTIHDWIVKRQLSGIKGIVEISGFGGYLKQYQVAIDPSRLNQFNITIEDIITALENNNQNTGSGYVEKGDRASYIRAEGLLRSLEDIEGIVVSTPNNIPILMRDVAKVNFGSPVRYGAMTKDGNGETVGGITLMLKGANANKVIDNVKQRIEKVNNSLPEGVVIKPYLDRSDLVGRVIKTIATNLTEAAIIVLIVLVLLLGNLRAGILTASVIPLSLLFAFSLMNMFGVTASIMSLGAIDFGLIVDGTIIIIEGILFYLHSKTMGKKLNQREFDTIIAKSAGSVGKSAAFGIAIILIVYFPILSLTGIEGKMFKPMAITIAFALIGALILSLTYVPVMASLILKKDNVHETNFSDKIVAAITSFFNPLVNYSLKNKLLVLGVSIGLFLSSLLLFGQLGAVFIPNLEEGDLAMQMVLPPGSSLNQSIKLATAAEKKLLDKFPEVKSVVSKIGTAEVPTDPMAIEEADVMIVMKDRNEWTTTKDREELIGLMKKEVESISGAEFDFTQPIQLRFNELITGAKSDVVIKIFGEDLDVLFDNANKVEHLIKDIQGAADIRVEQIEGLPQATFTFNRTKLARYGLNAKDINTVIRTAFAGEMAGVIFEGERRFDLVVRLEEQYRDNIDNIKRLFIDTPMGTRVPLSELVHINYKEGPMQISRDDTRRRITIGINVRNRDVKSLVSEIESTLTASLKLPPGYNITYGGEFENLQTASQRLLIVLPIALGLIFILLFFTFGSLKQAFIIYGTIPLSIIGGIAGLWLRGMPFSISAGIGFIALFGVAVLNGIVLINQLNLLKSNGITDVDERIRKAVKIVVRPVSLTTLVASLGFIPMAISSQAGAEVQRPLATVVIGGLIVAAILTMAIIPILYSYSENGSKVKMPKSSIATILIIGFVFLCSAESLAQQNISLTEAFTIAENNNLNIKSGALQVQQAIHNKKAEFNLGLTEIESQYGQINSTYKDYAVEVKQDFGNLFQMASNVKYAGIQVDQQKVNQELRMKELRLQVSHIYFSWQHQNSRAMLMEQINDGYTELAKIAALRQQTGETNLLESMTLKNSANAAKVQLDREKYEAENLANQFNFLLNGGEAYLPQVADIENDQVNQRLFDTTNVENSTNLRLQKQETALAKQNIRMQRSGFLPELYLGYFNQQIDGVKGFEGIQGGIAIPLWFRPARQKTKVAKLSYEQAEIEYQLQKDELNTQLQNLMNQYNNLLINVKFYNDSALPNANEMQRNANLLYQNGEIAYIEFIQAIEQAIAVKFEYLSAVNQLKDIESTIVFLLN
ncbi:CusA/CzcA family heavy metal efflux RND transporter [Saccharicrinis aurantiacus]|uniref:CusA/CzcA family heavy metal efflux RND transporter n=1 Tax=Saccharicrinis aurantiacus TaxID=1849719 RepID=UPI0024903255|nr:CusA/CzcA family heavy metal efflux RND transporter [Saccharicrinis aurantiacus]